MTDLLDTPQERRDLAISDMQLRISRLKRQLGQRARSELNRVDFSPDILQDVADLYLRISEADDQFRQDHGIKLDMRYPDWVKVYARELQRVTGNG
jgi:hypothetical protein